MFISVKEFLKYFSSNSNIWGTHFFYSFWCSNMSFGVIIRLESEAFQVSNLARVFKCSTPSFVDTHVFDFLI